MICSYCADRLRSNRDVSRSVFNRLNVVDPPRCISVLNLFERTFIKCCMPCVTMVRLGQISNTKRLQKELNSVLKGRTVYLPIDVSANSSFLAEKIRNFDSLVLMVGGQPTVTIITGVKMCQLTLWKNSSKSLILNYNM